MEGDAQTAGVRILLVDDSAPERRAMAALLEQAGYEVDEADSGAGAVLALQSRGCDLLLLDLQMPGMSGFAVLEYLQKAAPDFPVILMSGLPPDQIQEETKRLSSRSLPPLLLKPMNPQQLLSVVALRLEGELPG